MRPPGLSCSHSGGGRWPDAQVTMIASNGASSVQPKYPSPCRQRTLVIALLAQRPFALCRKRLDDLDGKDVRCQLRQDRGLVARAGADLEHLRLRRQLQQLGHQRHDVRLRDRLAVADGQRRVVVRTVCRSRRHECVAGNGGHRAQDRRALDAPSIIEGLGDLLLDHRRALGRPLRRARWLRWLELRRGRGGGGGGVRRRGFRRRRRSRRLEWLLAGGHHGQSS